MSRPKKERYTTVSPACYYFKPRGVSMIWLQEIVLDKDELEAIRLCDYLGMSHASSAFAMKISRPTFTRIVRSARRKISDCVLNGKAIKIGNGFPEEINPVVNIKC